MIAGVFLAAGRSRRFGASAASKLLREVRGKPLLYYGLDACVTSDLPAVHVVLGGRKDALQAEVERFFPKSEKLRIIRNENPERGMMSSVKCGIRSLDARYDGAMVVLADMPGISASLINALIQVYEREKKIVIPEHRHRLCHPRIIPASLFAEFLEIEDDGTGATVIDAHGDEIVRVKIGDASTYIDIDEPGDLEAFSKTGEKP